MGIGLLNGIGAGTSLLGTALGGIMSGVYNRKNRKIVDSELKEARDQFNRDYYGDILSRSDIASVLGRARDQYADFNRRAARTAAVTGATPESVVAQKKANAEAYADAVGNVAAQASTVRDNAQAQYNQTRNALMGQLMQSNTQMAQNWANVAGNSSKALAGLFTQKLNS